MPAGVGNNLLHFEVIISGKYGSMHCMVYCISRFAHSFHKKHTKNKTKILPNNQQIDINLLNIKLLNHCWTCRTQWTIEPWS